MSCFPLPLSNPECSTSGLPLYPRISERKHNVVPGLTPTARSGHMESSSVECGNPLHQNRGQKVLSSASIHLYHLSLNTQHRFNTQGSQIIKRNYIFNYTAFSFVSLMNIIAVHLCNFNLWAVAIIDTFSLYRYTVNSSSQCVGQIYIM